MLNTRRVCVQFNMTALPPWVTARQLNSHTQVTSQQCGHRQTATWHLLGDMLDHPVTWLCDRKWTMAKRKTPMGLFATSNTVIKHLLPDWSIYFVGATQDQALCSKWCGNDRARHFWKWYDSCNVVNVVPKPWSHYCSKHSDTQSSRLPLNLY